MIIIPSWLEFVAWIGSAAFVVPIVEWLKTLPRIGAWVERSAFLLVAVLTAAAPVLSQALLEHLPSIDAWLWTALYAAAMFGINQFVYKAGKATGKIS